MRCRAAQKKLSAYLDGELPAEVSAAIAEHMSACPRCAEGLARQQALSKALDALPVVAAPEGFARSVRREAERRRVFPLPWAPAPVVARAAAMLAVAAGVVMGGLMSASAAGVRQATAQAAQEDGATDLSASILGAVPEGSLAETYLEWMGELE